MCSLLQRRRSRTFTEHLWVQLFVCLAYQQSNLFLFRYMCTVNEFLSIYLLVFIFLFYSSTEFYIVYLFTPRKNSVKFPVWPAQTWPIKPIVVLMVLITLLREGYQCPVTWKHSENCSDPIYFSISVEDVAVCQSICRFICIFITFYSVSGKKWWCWWQVGFSQIYFQIHMH